MELNTIQTQSQEQNSALAHLEDIERMQRKMIDKLEEVMNKLDLYGSELENVKTTLKDIKARI